MSPRRRARLSSDYSTSTSTPGRAPGGIAGPASSTWCSTAWTARGRWRSSAAWRSGAPSTPPPWRSPRYGMGTPRPAWWRSGGGSHDTDGVILVTSELTGSQLEQLREADIPLVVLDPGNPPPPDLPSVGATNWAGGLAATEHLLGLGHHRIGAIAGPGDYLCSRARTDGDRSAL